MGRASAPMATAPTSSTSSGDLAALERAITLVRAGKQSAATETASAIEDPVARKVAEWITLRSDNNGVSVERYRAFVQSNPDWPSQIFFRRRAEAALWDDRRDDATVLKWFETEEPLSAKGRLALAGAMLNRGDRRGAEKLVREAWRSDSMTAALESAALDRFGPLLAPGDHKARMDMLCYGSDSDGALRAARRLGAGYVALARARIAAAKRDSNAKALLSSVPSELQSDPGHIFARIQLLRRDDKIVEAGQLMLSAPRDQSRLHNVDEWWIERRLVARKLLDIGQPRLAYQVARDAVLPDRDIYKTEQEFTAGWIALRFLNDPATAIRHFDRIDTRTENPTALARAGYWLGRAYEASGQTQRARSSYETSAQHATSYYGQLSRARLGLPQLGLNPQPRSGRGERYEVVRAAELLYRLDERDLAATMMADLGEKSDPDALVALGELATRHNDARGMLLMGKAALNRGLPFDHYAYPLKGIPSFRPIAPEVEPSIIYAISRQESGFNPRVVSPAQAYGLMQVTPAAGRYIAKRYGIGFDLNRMKTDSVYNATLGAAELASLLDDYRGSYVMSFAAYNAGRGSVRKWVERYGDPRDPKVDTVDWVESIPFAETRNYVQRIMENLQVYRARFGGGSRLQIEADLRRGEMSN